MARFARHFQLLTSTEIYGLNRFDFVVQEAANVRTLDLTSIGLANTTVYVQAVGLPSITNKTSAGVAVANDPIIRPAAFTQPTYCWNGRLRRNAAFYMNSNYAYDGNVNTAATIDNTPLSHINACVTYSGFPTTTNSTLTLRVASSADYECVGSSSIAYSTNGGSSWTPLRSGCTWDYVVDSVTLPVGTDASQVQVQSYIYDYGVLNTKIESVNFCRSE